MNLKNNLSEHVFLPFSDFLTGQTVSKNLKFLLTSQFWSKEQIIEFQTRKLVFLINHAFNTVPYYHDLMNNLGLNPSDIKELSDIQKLPVLTKAIIKKEGIERMTSNKVLPRFRMAQSSSGSTGEPLFYTTTKEAYSMNIAANLRGWYGMGYRLGDKYVKLSQNQRNAPLKRLQDYFSNNLYLATNPLNEENFEYILQEIERYKPKVIRCYPDPLLMLARYKRSSNIYKFTPNAITTTGNTLYPETRKEIEDAFGCRIFDSYSCEGNSNVFECWTHAGYHSAEEYGISEVLDGDGKSISVGVGKLISTDLWNLSHPFIRFDTQDLVEVDSEKCKCGRCHLKYNRIIGRDNDILKMPNGRFFIVHNFTGFFQTDHLELNRSIEQFQVVKRKDVVIFKLSVNSRYKESIGQFIKNYWKEEFNYNVEIEIVPEIIPSSNGKLRFIMNED